MDDEPYTASLVPKIDEYGQLVVPPSGAITYSKGAAIFGMLEAYWEAGRAGSFQVKPHNNILLMCYIRTWFVMPKACVEVLGYLC